MEKTLTIDGKVVKFKSTGGTLYRYKAQFGRELLVDVAELSKLKKLVDKASAQGKKITQLDDVETAMAFKHINLEVLFNIAWVLARTADSTVPEPLEWLDTFEEFPVKEILPEIMSLLTGSMTVDRKNA